MTETPSPADDQPNPKRRRLKSAIAKTAPEIAEALGGPLAGAAMRRLSRVIFGKDAVDEDDLAAAIEGASPEVLLALREADRDFRLAVARLDLDGRRLDADDRANARARHAAMRDRTPAVLGGIIIAGFFATLGVMVARKLPPGAETEFSIMLGSLATMTAAVVNYYFGSSVGSREKDRLLTPPSSLVERERR